MQSGADQESDPPGTVSVCLVPGGLWIQSDFGTLGLVAKTIKFTTKKRSRYFLIQHPDYKGILGESRL